MFTGIIETVGTLTAVDTIGNGRRLTVNAPFSNELRVDESVAIAGVCTTVVAQTAATFSVVAVEETLAKTTFGTLRRGDPVNLERAMRLGGRLDGHMVQGHVDTTMEVTAVRRLETSWLVSLRFESGVRPYLIPVGSVALDGISLTIARLSPGELSVAIIPHTWDHTTVRHWSPGRRVNVELDMVGKYVVGFLEQQAESGATVEWLRSKGFGAEAGSRRE